MHCRYCWIISLVTQMMFGGEFIQHFRPGSHAKFPYAYRLVADDVEAQQSVAAASHVKQMDECSFFVDAALEPHGFFILSAAGTIHPVHVDGSGFCTLIGVVDSHKIFILGCPTSDTTPTPPNMEGSDPFILMWGPDITVYLIVVKTSNLLWVHCLMFQLLLAHWHIHSLMPSRTYHAVVTLHLKPAVLQGTFFDSQYVMKHMLAGLVECALWHNHWMNMLYKECFIILAFLLDWHARVPLHKVRFTGENLYMLLFAAKYSTWLVPFTAATPKELSTYNPASLLVSHDSNGIHAFLLHRANQVLKLLPPCETTLFWNFERTFKAHIGHEYKSMYNVLMGNEESSWFWHQGPFWAQTFTHSFFHFPCPPSFPPRSLNFPPQVCLSPASTVICLILKHFWVWHDNHC